MIEEWDERERWALAAGVVLAAVGALAGPLVLDVARPGDGFLFGLLLLAPSGFLLGVFFGAGQAERLEEWRRRARVTARLRALRTGPRVALTVAFPAAFALALGRVSRTTVEYAGWCGLGWPRTHELRDHALYAPLVAGVAIVWGAALWRFAFEESWRRDRA